MIEIEKLLDESAALLGVSLFLAGDEFSEDWGSWKSGIGFG